MLKGSQNQKGFTLVELLAVIVILGVIAAIAVPAIGNVIDHSKTDALAQTEKLIIDAADTYLLQAKLQANGTTTIPNPLTVNDLFTAGFLKSVPNDPTTNTSMATWVITHDGKTASAVAKPAD